MRNEKWQKDTRTNLIRVVWEQSLLCDWTENGLWAGVHTLHLVEDDSLVHQRVRERLQLQVPTLLFLKQNKNNNKENLMSGQIIQ